MLTSPLTSATPLGTPPPLPLTRICSDSLRFWEPRRILYNLILAAVVLVWLIATWPHFRPAFTLHNLLLMAMLGLIANVCYCAAYFIDLPLQLSSFAPRWKSRRWVLWTIGTLLAFVLANYWIVDEIYPFVR